jgi:DNA-binding SARP family transcriptional activator
MPYLTSFSIERGINTKSLHEFKHLTGKDRIIFATKQPNYNISFDINAINLSHAKTIHLNIQKLLRMIYPKLVINTTTVSRVLVKMKNLIGVKGQIFETEEPVQCICTDLNIKPNLDMGFFEDNGMLYYKSFSLNLSLQSNDSDFGD